MKEGYAHMKIDKPQGSSIAATACSSETRSQLHSKLRDALSLAQPNIGKPYLYDRCVTKYLTAMLPAISQAIGFNYKDIHLQPGDFFFAQAKMLETIGTIGSEQQYIYQLMRDNDSTSVLHVVHKGFSQNGVSKLSTVKLNPLYKDLVVEELLNLRIEANQELLDEIEANANYTVNVDPASLASYIRKTTER